MYKRHWKAILKMFKVVTSEGNYIFLLSYVFFVMNYETLKTKEGSKVIFIQYRNVANHGG